MISPVDTAAAAQAKALHKSNDNKFQNPFLTASGKQRGYIKLNKLTTIWFNTGTLCNIECQNCYIKSSPKNDAMVYLSHSDVVEVLDEAEELNLSKNIKEIGITGGEPFLNKDCCKIVQTCLDRGFKVLLLTNAMQPMQRKTVSQQLLNLKNKQNLTLRISLDHYSEEIHNNERGKNSFEIALKGLKLLNDNNFNIALAARSSFGVNEQEIRQGFKNLVDKNNLRIDVNDPKSLVLFPEINQTNTPEITTQCFSILNIDPNSIMCSSSRMVVKYKGNDKITVLPCTLLPYSEGFHMGASLKKSFGYTAGSIQDGRVMLNHPNCSKFCVLGKSSCS